MAGRSDYCRCEPNLEELLGDEMMESVLRSAGFDSQGFREMIAETACRFGAGRHDPRGLSILRLSPARLARERGAPSGPQG
jgi:hypothetical protein